ncbi:Anthranilate N-benzoyltransferase protein 1 [Bienertia sinuspersici]
MMSIKVKETSMITPAEATPKTSLWLSKLDMIIRTPYSHTNVLFLYNNHNNDDNNSSSTYFDTNILKESLSKSLVPFYPMAGRLTFDSEKQRYEIDCNAEGALFIEAESPQTLAEFGDYTKLECQLRKFVFPTCDYSNGLSSFPLLLVQVTRFKCGSVSLGFAQHHHVADGFSHLHFINSWARLAKGLEIVIEPVHDRATYLSPRQPPLVQFQHLEYDPPLPPMPLSGACVSSISLLPILCLLTYRLCSFQLI